MREIGIFIDRDGTLGGDGGGMHPKDFPLYDGTIEGLKLLTELGLNVYIITNQSRIARGYFTEEEFNFHTNQMICELKKEGIIIRDYYYCPHHHEDKTCLCRKPKAGMINTALKQYPEININKSYVVGDNGEADMCMADEVGAKKILVCTGWGRSSLTTHRHLWKSVKPDYIAENFYDAAQWIAKDISN